MPTPLPRCVALHPQRCTALCGSVGGFVVRRRSVGRHPACVDSRARGRLSVLAGRDVNDGRRTARERLLGRRQHRHFPSMGASPHEQAGRRAFDVETRGLFRAVILRNRVTRDPLQSHWLAGWSVEHPHSPHSALHPSHSSEENSRICSLYHRRVRCGGRTSYASIVRCCAECLCAGRNCTFLRWWRVLTATTNL